MKLSNRDEQLITARNRLDMYLEAEKNILTSQEYRIGSRSLRRAELDDVQKKIKELQNDIARLEAGGKNKAVRGVPLDM